MRVEESTRSSLNLRVGACRGLCSDALATSQVNPLESSAHARDDLVVDGVRGLGKLIGRRVALGWVTEQDDGVARSYRRIPDIQDKLIHRDSRTHREQPAVGPDLCSSGRDAGKSLGVANRNQRQVSGCSSSIEVAVADALARCNPLDLDHASRRGHRWSQAVVGRVVVRVRAQPVKRNTDAHHVVVRLRIAESAVRCGQVTKFLFDAHRGSRRERLLEFDLTPEETARLRGPVGLNLGALTPPLGVLVFATANIAKVKINEVYKEVMPFFWALMVVLALVTYVPWISLGLTKWLAP